MSSRPQRQMTRLFVGYDYQMLSPIPAMTEAVANRKDKQVEHQQDLQLLTPLYRLGLEHGIHFEVDAQQGKFFVAA